MGLAFKNSLIYVEGKGIIPTSLKVEDGIIASIGEDVGGIELPTGWMILPGFIDQHVHGASRSDGMYANEKDLQNIARTLASEGVTAFLATTMTQSIENIEAALRNIGEYVHNNHKEGAQVLGAHLEGPFINKKFKGAQPEEFIIDCNVDTFKRFEKASQNTIRLVTYAFEQNGSELTKYLKRKNIVASLGHTDATAKEVLEAASLGATCLTHSYNAMKPLHHREAGTIGGAMLADTVYCEIICDLVHVSKEAIQILHKIKTSEKIILVTDGIEAKHLDDGTYRLGGQEVSVHGKEARLVSGALAGSTLYMNEAIKNAIEVLQLPMEEVVDMATKNPAKLLGIYQQKGSITVGKDADLVIVDDQFNVVQTIRGGNIVYKK